MDPVGRLIAAFEASGLKQLHVAKAASVGKTRLNRILLGKQIPTITEYVDIARAIGVDPGRLISDGELVIDLDQVRTAQGHSKQVFDFLSSWLPEARPLTGTTRSLAKRTVSHDAAPVRAAANPNAELIAEFESVRRRIPRRAWNRGARIIVRAVGDSMDGGASPIRNGELTYLRQTSSARMANNRIALVRRGEGLYLKLFEKSGNTLRLVSTNGEKTIEIDLRHEEIEIFGYVVDQGPAPAPES